MRGQSWTPLDRQLAVQSVPDWPFGLYSLRFEQQKANNLPEAIISTENISVEPLGNPTLPSIIVSGLMIG